MGDDRGAAVSLWPVVRTSFVRFSTPLEGCVSHLYLDVKGLVTCAIGVLVDPIELALALPWVRADGGRATRAEVAAEWHTIKGRPELARQGHRAAAALCQLHLTAEGVELVTLDKLDAMVRALARRFAEMGEWPAPAQLAVVSLAWACGAGFRFPRLEAALRAWDFATAADECAMNATGNPGLLPRNRANRRLLLEAADAIAQERSPDVLLFSV